jgi:hypothetical protein
MPAMVGQSFGVVYVIALPLVLWAFVDMAAGERRPLQRFVPVLLGGGVAALLFAFRPINPFAGFGGRVRVGDLDAEGRRALRASYDPALRRRAVRNVLLTGCLFVAAGFASRWVHSPNIPPSGHGGWAAPTIIVWALCAAGGLAAIFGDLRKGWKDITTAGSEWPVGVEYPGPFGEVCRSFATGKWPGFLRQTESISMDSSGSS